jgi:hypothetical protein
MPEKVRPSKKKKKKERKKKKLVFRPCFWNSNERDSPYILSLMK